MRSMRAAFDTCHRHPGQLDSVHILIKEEEKVVERHVFDFQLSLNHKQKPKKKQSMENAFMQFLQGDSGLANLTAYYSAVTQHLIRLVQGCCARLNPKISERTWEFECKLKDGVTLEPTQGGTLEHVINTADALNCLHPYANLRTAVFNINTFVLYNAFKPN